MKIRNLQLLLICALAFFACAAPPVLGDWDPGDPHKMHFPQLPDPNGWDACITHQFIADDFRCTETGPITDIHFWISWKADDVGEITDWDISIWSDRDGKPGIELWTWNGQGIVTIRSYGTGDQGWVCPSTPLIEPKDHKLYEQINITKIPPDSQPFVQQEGAIYWLVIRAKLSTQIPRVGWKTSVDAPPGRLWGSPALWSPNLLEWQPVNTGTANTELHDMAFVITGGYQDLDFGDAPDRPYPTTLWTNGARHVIVPGFFLGSIVRVSQESSPGLGDFDDNVLGFVEPYMDVNTTAQYYQYGNPYGASFNGPEPPLTSGRSHLFLVHASDGLSLFVVHDKPVDVGGGSSRMHWEVFGDSVELRQGDDPGEVVTITGGGTIIDSSHGWGGCCTDGFAVGSLDGQWTMIGDFNIPPGSTGMTEWHVYSSDNSSIPLAFEMNRRVRLEYYDAIDPEPDGQPNATATGDDNDGNDDESGVIFTSPLIPGRQATVTVIASAPGLLHAWIDFSKNDSWADAEDNIFAAEPLNAGVNYLEFPVPVSAIPNIMTYARFRFTSAVDISFDGLAPDGEVEDYTVEIKPKPLVEHLKWSQPPIEIIEGTSSNYELYAIRFYMGTQSLHSIDPDTGASTYIGSADPNIVPFGLSDLGGKIYTYDRATDSVLQLDPGTGKTIQAIDIGTVGVTSEGAMAFRSDGIGFLASTLTGKLWSFDITGPSSTYIGPMSIYFDGIDFDADNVLYGLRQSPTIEYQLYTIDQTDGTTTLIGDTGVIGNTSVAGLTFAPDGTLYAAFNGNLYTINPANGAATEIGPTDYNDFSGLTAVAVPKIEPYPPVYCGWDERSFKSPVYPTWFLVADDFRCLGTMPISSVHWWGSYLGWDQPGIQPPELPMAWRIGFWSNVPAPPPPKCVVIPNANTSVEGNVRNAWPFNLAWYGGGASSMRYQQIYDSAEIGQSGTITEIRFRPDDTWGAPFGPNTMDCEIFLGYSANPVSSPSEWFANNIGPGYVKVFDGTLTLSSTDIGGPPRNFDIVVDVDDIFTYNPAIGPLLLDVRMLVESATTQFDAAGYGDGQTATTRIYSHPSGSVNDPNGIVNYTGPNDDPYGLVTMLCFDGYTPAMAVANNTTATQPIEREACKVGIGGDVLGSDGSAGAKQAADPSVQQDEIIDFSYPEKLLYTLEVPADRVQVEEVARDYYHGYYPNDVAYQYTLHLEPDEYFWQSDFIEDTKDNIFWLSIAAIYDPCLPTPTSIWGWKTRPWSWIDDAVRFSQLEPLEPGIVTDPDRIIPIKDPIFGESFDVAFELDTDPCYIKWEQPFTGIRRWPHYEDEESMAKEIIVTETLAKHIQKPDLEDTGIDVDATVEGQWAPQVIADDFNCISTGPLTHITIFGSWYNDILPEQRPDYVVFKLSIHKDIPKDQNPNGYSMPGEVLRSWTFQPGEFGVKDIARELNENYYVPCEPYYERNADWTCYRYDFDFDPRDAFVQEGSPGRPAVYWLSIQAQPLDNKARFGWKTSVNHWNDDAVWGKGDAPQPDSWQELIYPPEHPYNGKSIDMAFEITTTETRTEIDFARLIADDWECEQKTPVTACVWWGSYIDYRYLACQGQQMAPPTKPYYFLLSIWTDTPAGPGPGGSFSHPRQKIWEYKAYNYDEVLVGYDKHPISTSGAAPFREPVFRYSVKLPKDEWFLQKDVSDIYWFSVVAVYKTNPRYPWGWTNHKHVFNDDAVAGYVYPPGPPHNWTWMELRDQTGSSADMSFMLFTEPGCFPATHPDYFKWLAAGKPDCWCYPRQCHGDADNLPFGKNNYWTALPDLEVLKAAWNKPLAQIQGKTVIDYDPSCIYSCNVSLICADFDHKPYGKFNYRVALPDLTILKANWNIANKPDPNCFAGY